MQPYVYTDKIHLVSENLELLHEFAKEVGIGKWYYEGYRKGHPHYDIPKKKLKAVLAFEDVQIVSPRRVLEVSKECYTRSLGKMVLRVEKPTGQPIPNLVDRNKLIEFWGKKKYEEVQESAKTSIFNEKPNK